MQAVTILKRNGGRANLTEKRFPSDGVARSYEDEIRDVSRNLSESEVQLNFPMALEILLDFTFFDVDEGMLFSINAASLERQLSSDTDVMFQARQSSPIPRAFSSMG